MQARESILGTFQKPLEGNTSNIAPRDASGEYGFIGNTPAISEPRAIVGIHSRTPPVGGLGTGSQPSESHPLTLVVLCVQGGGNFLSVKPSTCHPLHCKPPNLREFIGFFLLPLGEARQNFVPLTARQLGACAILMILLQPKWLPQT